MSPLVTIILYSLIGGLFSLAGGLLLVWKANWANKVTTSLLAFSAGAFLGVSFLDILPEAIEMSEDVHKVFIAVLVGFVIFFLLERGLMKFFHGQGAHPHEHAEHTESLSTLVVLGDSIHNFLDGILIALAYIANPVLGLVTALGVAAHEIPQEIADFSVLLSQGWSRKKVIIVNIFQSLLTIPGVVIGYYAGSLLLPFLPYLLGGTAGIFLYIAASDLIPEIHHRTGHKHFYRVAIPLVLSIAIIAWLIEVTHG
jgi:zinc and cadmium transporter